MVGGEAQKGHWGAGEGDSLGQGHVLTQRNLAPTPSDPFCSPVLQGANEGSEAGTGNQVRTRVLSPSPADPVGQGSGETTLSSFLPVHLLLPPDIPACLVGGQGPRQLLKVQRAPVWFARSGACLVPSECSVLTCPVAEFMNE